MDIHTFADYEELSSHTARAAAQQVKDKPDSVICLASGDTPLRAYKLFTQQLISQNIDYSKCTIIGLDEWVGIQPANTGSCHYFLQQNVLQPLNLKASQYRLFNGLAADLESECKSMDDFIRKRGGIDLMIVGLGMNGHIGFNEPGVSFDLYSHVIDLDEKTTQVGQKYFSETTSLRQGITLGMKHFIESRKVLLVVNGEKKASILQQTVEDEISTLVPASRIRQHKNGHIMLDRAAAMHLGKPVL